MIELQPLTLYDADVVRKWRNGCRETLRDPDMLTDLMQDDYYRNVVCNRDSKARLYAVKAREDELLGMVGLHNISLHNGNAEISLIISPEHRHKGYGRGAVSLILHEAFDVLRLHCVYGECYETGATGFWESLSPSFITYLPDRKFWKGEYHSSMYFSFARGAYDGRLRNSGKGEVNPYFRQEHEAVCRDSGASEEHRVRQENWVREGGGIE